MGSTETDSIRPYRKTSALPLACARNHQIYAVWFPALDGYGFACGLCHELGTTVTKGNEVLAIRYPQLVEVPRASVRENLMLYSETKAAHLTCGWKGHPLMIFQLREGEGYAFGCIHCKRYSKELLDKDRVLEIFVLRELARREPSVIIH